MATFIPSTTTSRRAGVCLAWALGCEAGLGWAAALGWSTAWALGCRGSGLLGGLAPWAGPAAELSHMANSTAGGDGGGRCGAGLPLFVHLILLHHLLLHR